MGRIGLTSNLKFRHLATTLGSRMLARGALELLWEPAYEIGDPYVGTSDDVEAVCGWTGAKGALTRALLAAGTKSGAGFIEPYAGSVREATEPHYQIHDFFHHCPEYVKGRRERELQKNTAKTCAMCGGDYYSSQESQFCGQRCRVRAYRERHAKAEPPYHTPLRPVTAGNGTPTPTPTPARTYSVPADDPSTSVRVVERKGGAEALTRSASPPPVTPVTALAVTDPSPVLLVFPVVGGKAKKGEPPRTTWPLHQSRIDEWTAAFGTLNILDECRRALSWVNANPEHRKTYDGMPSFLHRWFSKSVNFRGGGRVITGSLKTAGNQAAMEEFLRRRGHAVDK